MLSEKRVLVGMSGGVDSSAVCLMLIEQGYQPVGVTMRMWDAPSKFSIYNQDEPDYIVEARVLAQKLGFPHHVLDVRREFRAEVVQDFLDEYMGGRTPNPCVMCNLFFKWKYLLEMADKLDCHWIATGHYAKVKEENGIKYIEQGVDSTKDQSYFLWRLGQKELSRTLFPLGGLSKVEVKDYVIRHGFREKAQKSESMEVCFVEKDYRDFLREQIPDIDHRIGEGSFVDTQGRRLGKHKGFPYYTIGQRKGLEIALGYPAFVIKINPQKNIIMLGRKEDVFACQMSVSQVQVANLYDLSHPELKVRIRYRSQPISCRVRSVGEHQLLVDFTEEASAVTPGQSAVFYINERVVGGGIIDNPSELKRILKKE